MYHLYSVALALVPDADVAGDLFMRARDEEHLLRLVAAWRRAQGLEPMDPPFSLPELSPEQKEHADHLARRSRLRRRALTTVGAVGAIGTLALAAALFLTRPAPQGLATAPVFQGTALSAIPSASGVTLSVYKAEAQPGSVMVWWDLKGPNAADAIKDLAPELYLGSSFRRLKPAATETAVLRRDRVVARTVYRVYVTTSKTVVLLVPGIKGSASEQTHEVPLDRSALSDTVTVAVIQTVQQGPATVTVKSISLSALGTTVRYTGQAPPETELPTIMGIDNQQVRAARSTMGQRRQEGADYVQNFPPISVAATALTLTFTPPVESLGSLSVNLPSPLVTFDTTTGAQRAAAINLPFGQSPGPGQPYAVDATGRKYFGTYTLKQMPPNGTGSTPGGSGGVIREQRFTLAIQFNNLPPQVELVGVTVPSILKAYSGFEVQVDLTHPSAQGAG